MSPLKLLFISLPLYFQAMWADPAPYLYVDLHMKGHGMFSVFCYVAGALHDYDTQECSGIEVDFGENGFYFDPAYGPNWWEYYCEPIRLGCLEEGVLKNVNPNYSQYAYFIEKQMNREAVNQLIVKYIHLKEQVQNKIDQFIQENFSGTYVIGVHYRGTDKKGEAPRVPFVDVQRAIDLYLHENQIENYKIFVATDELQFIEFMREAYPGLILVYSTIHSEDGKPLHRFSSNKYLQGEEALIDCILLSKSDFLIRTSSNLSLWSTFFNPTLPVIELSERIIRVPKPPRPQKPVKLPKTRKPKKSRLNDPTILDQMDITPNTQ